MQLLTKDEFICRTSHSDILLDSVLPGKVNIIHLKVNVIHCLGEGRREREGREGGREEGRERERERERERGRGREGVYFYR